MAASSKVNVLLWVIILLLIVIISAMGSFMFHAHKHWRNHEPMNRGDEQSIEYLEKKLNLTSEQKEKFKVIIDKYEPKINSLKGELNNKKTELINELSASNTDTVKLNTLENNIATLKIKTAKIQINMFMDMKKLCNPEQLERLTLITKNRMIKNENKKVKSE